MPKVIAYGDHCLEGCVGMIASALSTAAVPSELGRGIADLGDRARQLLGCCLHQGRPVYPPPPSAVRRGTVDSALRRRYDLASASGLDHRHFAQVKCGKLSGGSPSRRSEPLVSCEGARTRG